MDYQENKAFLVNSRFIHKLPTLANLQVSSIICMLMRCQVPDQISRIKVPRWSIPFYILVLVGFFVVFGCFLWCSGLFRGLDSLTQSQLFIQKYWEFSLFQVKSNMIFCPFIPATFQNQSVLSCFSITSASSPLPRLT